MIKIERILCPTDLSLEADEALRYAVALAGAYEAKLFLLCCLVSEAPKNEERTPTVAAARLFTESLAPYLNLKINKDLDWQGLTSETSDGVANAIVNEAGKQKIDLIVMRSRRRPIAAKLLGSTAETVCRTAPCPVLVTHPKEREWLGPTGEIGLKRILVAYDFSADAALALRYGLSLAQEYQTELHLIHVLGTQESEPELAWSNASGKGLYKTAARQLQAAVPKEAFLWCNVTSVVRCGNPAEQVLEYSKQREIDLICIGVSGTRFSLGVLFGSTTDSVLRKTPCPVLVARPIKSTDPSLLTEPEPPS